MSYFLRNTKEISLTCWEKARGVGGRFATKRHASGARVDHGAQFRGLIQSGSVVGSELLKYKSFLILTAIKVITKLSC